MKSKSKLKKKRKQDLFFLSTTESRLLTQYTLTILQFINSDQMPGLYSVASIANLRSSSSLASTLGPLAN